MALYACLPSRELHYPRLHVVLKGILSLSKGHCMFLCVLQKGTSILKCVHKGTCFFLSKGNCMFLCVLQQGMSALKCSPHGYIAVLCIFVIVHFSEHKLYVPT